MLLKREKEFLFLLVLLVSLCSSSFLPTFLQFQGCEKRVQSWVAWSDSGGLDGKILVKEAGDPALPTWTVVMQLDKSVNSFRVYDTKTEKLDDRTYKISPLSWNAEIKQEAKRILTLQVLWTKGEAEPKIRTLYVNGESFECMDQTEESNPPPEEASPEGAPDEGENDSSEVQNENETSIPPATTMKTTTMKTFVPTVAGERGIFAPWPKKVMGLYVLLADNSEKGFEDHVEWQPELYPYMQTGANVLFFTFIHPTTMKVPPAFKNLAKTRGTNQPGAVPKDTVILFALGGYAYSVGINPWPWLTSKAKAEEMAEKVALWPEEYGCDGIDLDIEDGAGDAPGAGTNMIHFIKKLRQLNPKMIIGQPTYGFPAIHAEIDVINASWDEKGNNKNLADSIGLMVYEGTNSLNYVKNYVDGTGRWEGFKIKVNAPSNTILLGAKGSTSPSAINTLVDESIKNNYLGVMVWYASVVDGLQYSKGTWDASTETSKPTQDAYMNGMKRFRNEL